MLLVATLGCEESICTRQEVDGCTTTVERLGNDRVELSVDATMLDADQVHSFWLIFQPPRSPPMFFAGRWLTSGIASSDGGLELKFDFRELIAPTDSVYLFLVDNGPPIPGREEEQRKSIDIGEDCTLGPLGTWCPLICTAEHFPMTSPEFGDQTCD